MASSSIFAAPLLSLAIFYLIYKHILYPGLLSPLCKLPTIHPTAGWSHLWFLRKRLTHQECSTIYEGHQKLGDVVRLGPTEVAINSLEGLRVVYGGNFDRHKWFFNVSAIDGVPNMLASQDAVLHGQGRKLMTHYYSKTSLYNSEDIRTVFETVIIDRMLPQIWKTARKGELVDAMVFAGAMSYDLITGVLFGLDNSSDMCQDISTRERVFQDYTTIRPWFPIMGELPNLNRGLAKIGIYLMPKPAVEAYGRIYKFIRGMCEAAKADTSPTSSVYKTAAFNYDKSDIAYPKDAKLFAEFFDQTAAAYELCTITMIYLIYETSRNAKIQEELKKEIQSLKFSGGRLPDFFELDKLPLLDAVIHETIRVYPAGALQLPRVVPPGGVNLSGYEIPAGTRISSNAYTLHRNEKAFPDPELWNPKRWLESSEEQLQEMRRWFWGFGSGPRICIGNHLALLELKCMTAAIYGNWATSLEDVDDMTHQPGTIGRPVGDRLFCKFEDVTRPT